MKRFWPLVFLLVYIGIVFKPFFIEGKIPIPADTIVGLYHPWRDSFAKNYPSGIPFKNFLITDSVRQQYPWRHLSFELFSRKELPKWNPYSFSGTPLLANFQSAAFYPLNLLFLIPDFQTVWGLLVILQVSLGGLFMYFYLRSLRLHASACVVGILAWIGSGFFVAWLEWNTVVHVAIWLPLILLAIDKLTNKRSFSWSLIYLFALCASFLAGYLQPFFYIYLLSAAYLLARIYQTKNYRLLPIFLLSQFSFLILVLPQLLPTLQFIGLSARDIDQANWNRPDWFIPWQHLAQFIAPDYFGNPTTLNYFGVWNYQEFVGYIGIPGLICAILAVIFRRDKKTLFFTGILLVALVFALPTLIAKLPYEFNLPFLSSSQPSRLLVIIDFALAVLAALGVDLALKHKLKTTYILPALLVGLCLGALWLLAPNEISTRNLYLPSALLATTVIILLVSKLKIQILWLLPLLLLFDLSRFATKFESFSPREYLYPQTKITRFLQKQAQSEVFRVAALDDRIFPPNFNIMYGIQMPSGYDPLYLKKYGEFIAMLERGKPDATPPWGFNRIITPKNYTDPRFKFLNVKYLLSFEKLPDLHEVLKEGQTRVYENPNYLPRAYFKSQTGTVKITSYQANSVEIQTSSSYDDVLVLLDVYYPSWRATVDGKPTNIYITNHTFRGIKVPKGSHTVRFFIE